MSELKRYISRASLLICTIIFPMSASAETCASLFDDELYEEALPLCLKAKDNFRLGFIYSRLNDCQNMEQYYKLSNSPAAKGNLGMSVLHGSRGCEKDVASGMMLLEEAIVGGSLGFGKTLGDHYRKIDNKKMAKVYYQLSVDTKSERDWEKARARESFGQLIDLFNEKELKNFYLNKINMSTHASVWEQELASKAINALKNLLDTEEKLELLLANTNSNSEYKCKIGESLYREDFNGLVVELKKQSKTDAFISRLCKGDKEYFLGKTFENGLGNKEDVQEAYRLYLIAGANGNEYAKAARDRIRDVLTPEQVKKASCLADYGIEPSFFDVVRCKF